MLTEPPLFRSDEDTVNLVVNGEVVRTATGPDSETLDWAIVECPRPRRSTGTIQIVDNNRFGWGHILADEFMPSSKPAQSALDDL